MDTNRKTKSCQKRNKNFSYLAFPKGIFCLFCLFLIFENSQEFIICHLKQNSTVFTEKPPMSSAELLEKWGFCNGKVSCDILPSKV